MKKTFRSKTVAGALALTLALSAFGLLSSFTPGASAESINKTFEIGAGTGQQRSHFRTFPVPCGQSVTATVKYRRLGDPGAANDVPIVIELRQPGPTASDDGPLVASRAVTAERTEKTETLNGASSPRGCDLPWRVRIRLASANVPPNAVTGNITITFSTASGTIDVEGGRISLNKGNSVTKNLGSSVGLKQGRIRITANWQHAIGPVPGPLPVRLQFELIDPNNLSVITASGFSSNEINPSATPKFQLNYTVPQCKPGQWKLKITNNTNDDTMNINPVVSFTPDCN